ncbi:hypothetical protein Acor_49480 [Acrocarpospora corrugata]|uniref:HipA N-terminal subdomain 1 domain-containing protein n=1 Tax=Acrocarpospora corrugata TaxID=35763 RepID=A0A5M3W4D0_9ACTN|nr:hypothetical protein Acor_49480 [Acrocarpospora corrugata]
MNALFDEDDEFAQKRACRGVSDDRRVGTLGYLDGNTWFDYEDIEPTHPILGQGFETNPRRRTASGSIPKWFANLLPEPGSGLRNLISQELGRSDPHDFQVLMFLGEDLPGAVRVVPESDISAIGRDQLGKVRFSLAGVQAKFSMRWEGKGLVLPMSGQGGDWIVKLPDRRFPEVPANEFAMLSWAKHAGVDVPEIELFTGADLVGLPDGLISPQEMAFAVRRFDRPPEGRVHQEDSPRSGKSPSTPSTTTPPTAAWRESSTHCARRTSTNTSEG